MVTEMSHFPADDSENRPVLNVFRGGLVVQSACISVCDSCIDWCDLILVCRWRVGLVGAELRVWHLHLLISSAFGCEKAVRRSLAKLKAGENHNSETLIQGRRHGFSSGEARAKVGGGGEGNVETPTSA